MDVPDLFQLLLHWPIEPVVSLVRLAGGTNNQAWLVKTVDQSAYVLRLTSPSGMADLARLQYEASLLTALRDTALPFRLPFPVPAHSGEYLVPVEQDCTETATAMLTSFLPGSIPERNASNVAGAGVALGQLDAALATLSPRSLLPDSETAPFRYGDLSHCHSLVPDPLAAIENLLSPDQVGPMSAILQQAQEDWLALCACELPQQVLHRDCGPGNVLMEKERVTAILDFEFAGVDWRVFDLGVALSWWPVRLMGTGQEWELMDVLGRAYTTAWPLVEEELLTLPMVLRLRDTTSLVSRIGRYLAGQETKETIQQRVDHSLWREAWLVANGERLVQHALAWNKPHM